MELKEIQDLIKLVNKSTLTEVEIEQKDFKLKIKRETPENNVIYTAPPATVAAAPAPVAQPAAPAAEAAAPAAEASGATPSAESSNLVEFKSPMIGTFYRSSSPENPPFVKVGDTVQKGDVLCIIEAMKLFNEIESEVDGKIAKILIDDSKPVEYDQVLFLIEPS